jgi:nitrite reductase/ring-hydroxylating ferredoxin subunit
MGHVRGTSERTKAEERPDLRDGRARWKRVLLAAAAVVAIAGISIYLAHAGGSAGNGMPIKATWIQPQVGGDNVSIPVSEVENHRNVHFRVETESGDMNFMAYAVNGQIHVRASVCPPCRGIAYSLENDVLVCDMCATTFRAATGDGIRGACVNYPKAAVPYDTVTGSIVMNKADLIAAYQDTLEPGWP